jgi:Rps23 Pro-64 3,4-dihydroxylase Tpa1-like proline 4-hydroxylase
MHREELAVLIAQKLRSQQDACSAFFLSQAIARYFYIDDLLPTEIVTEVFGSFPQKEAMFLRKNWREHKYMTAQMDLLAPLLEEIVYAFQDPSVVQILSEITGIDALRPDPDLYAGGISLMPKGGFMNPHIDNSHDRDRKDYRVLNLLYYVTPDWQASNGGNFEFWRSGLKYSPTVIVSHFNRLLVMAPNRQSLHSVNEVKVDRPRCCIVNYYFSPHSPEPLGTAPSYYSTSFRGRPGQHLLDLALVADAKVRTLGRGILDPLFHWGVLKNPHFYDRPTQTPTP